MRAEPQVIPSMMPRKRKPISGGLETSPFLSLSPPEWNPIFATHRENIQYAVENEPLIESWGLEDDIVRGFMKDVDESDACLPRADKVEQYCFGASLEALQAEKGDVGGPIALLDERSSACGEEQARRYRGPLTARQLYEELKRPVSWPKFLICSLRATSQIPTHSANPPNPSKAKVKGQADDQLYPSDSLLPQPLVRIRLAGAGARLLPAMTT